VDSSNEGRGPRQRKRRHTRILGRGRVPGQAQQNATKIILGTRFQWGSGTIPIKEPRGRIQKRRAKGRIYLEHNGRKKEKKDIMSSWVGE